MKAKIIANLLKVIMKKEVFLILKRKRFKYMLEMGILVKNYDFKPLYLDY